MPATPLHRRSSRCAVAGASIAILAACAPAVPADEARSPAGTHALPMGGWQRVATTPPWSPAPRDRGQGVLHHRQPGTDTAWFHAAPDSSADVTGALVTSPASDGSPQLALWAPVPLQTESVEYGYEESGVPYDSVAAGGRWHRAIIGYTADGRPHHGWTALAPPLQRLQWTDALMEQSLFFLDTAAAAFHVAPGGDVVVPPPAVAAGDFDMTAVEARWPWLRVKLEYPGRACDGEDRPDRQVSYHWIRALDTRGRPRIFYFTRGC